MPASLARLPYRCLTLALATLLWPAVAHALVPFAESGSARPDLVVEATLRLLPASPLAFLAISVAAGALALGLSASNALVLHTQTQQQERDLIALQARERRLRLAVQDSEDGVLHLDPVRDASGRVVDFVVTDANARAAALFRRDAQLVAGTRTSALASMASQTPLFHALVETLDSGATYRAEVRAHPRHVATSWLLVRAVKVDDGLALTLTDIRERKKESRRLHRASSTDALTGLLNRRGFLEHAASQLEASRRLGQASVLFYLDCDDFKGINDTYGHAVGDRALQEVARALRLSVRETDLVSRLGGDEFTILALDAIGPCADTIRTRIAERLEAVNNAGILPAPLAVSVGRLYVPASNTQPLAELLDAADRDLFLAKRARRAARGAMESIGRSTRSPKARASAGRAVAARAATKPVLTGVPSVA
jgi:diguanylate cyclase (GGDEF)-like protein